MLTDIIFNVVLIATAIISGAILLNHLFCGHESEKKIEELQDEINELNEENNRNLDCIFHLKLEKQQLEHQITMLEYENKQVKNKNNKLESDNYNLRNIISN